MEVNLHKLNENELSVPFEEEGYEIVYVHDSGGKVWRHELVDVKGVDYDDLLEIAIDKAQIGCIVHMLPTLAEDHPLRKIVFAKAKERKCPDLKINGEYTEVKIPVGNPHQRKINNNIKVAYAQANQIIIKLHSYFSEHRLAEISKGRFLSHKSLAVIEFKMAGIYYTFNRSDFI